MRLGSFLGWALRRTCGSCTVLTALALLEPIAVAVHFQDVDVVGAPVQQGACLGQRHEAQLIDDEQFVAVGSTMSRMLRQPELTL